MIKINSLAVLLLLLILTANFYAADIRILTDTNAVFYAKPGGKVQNYPFRERELLPVVSQTNIGGKDWLFVKLPGKKQGWLEAKYSEDFLNDPKIGKYNQYMLEHEVVSIEDFSYYITNKEDISYFYNLKFFDFSTNGYMGIRYLRDSNDGTYQVAVLYLIEKAGLKKVVFDNSNMDKVIFTDRFIFIVKEPTKVSVFDKQNFVKDDVTAGNPDGKLYKTSDTFSMIHLYVKKYGMDDANYFDFDEKTLEVTAHVKMKDSDQFLVEKWGFDTNNGRFVLMKSETNASSAQTLLFYTLTGDNVRVRSEAGTNGAVVATLGKGAKVKLIERTDIALTVGDKTGFWALVEFEKGGKTVKGYVFDAYLKEEK